MDSSSSPSGGDMLTCSRPLIERRLRPPHDQALKCPRCDSTHTKFCYYNNYSLSQPRYFCKTCRRYWTKGGTLRNIPVGGGCRKNKKVSKKSSNDHQSIINHQNPGSSSSSPHMNPTDLHLSFPHEMQLAHLNSILGAQGTLNIGMLENPRPIDFIMESKLEALVGSTSRNNYDFMGNGDDLGMVNGLGDMSHHHHHHHGLASQNFGGLCSPYGMTGLDHGNGTTAGTFMETCQRLMVPYDQGNDDQNAIDVKPNNNKLLSLDWQDQGCSSGKDTYGYGLNNLGSWTSMMNGYGSSTTNTLV